MRGKNLYLSLLLVSFYAGVAEGRTAIVGWHAYAQRRHDVCDRWHRQVSPRACRWLMMERHAGAMPVLEQNNEESAPLEYGSEQWHQEKKELDAMLWASIVIMTVLFTGIIMLTIIRMGRRYRKRITEDKKPRPTEYVDAWSQYRLPEDEDPNNMEES